MARAFLLIVAGAFAGCMAGSEITSCWEPPVCVTENGEIYLSGNAKEPIQLTLTDRDIVIHDFHQVTNERGMAIESNGCYCNVTIQDSTINSTDTSLMFSGEFNEVRIVNTTIVNLGGGVNTTDYYENHTVSVSWFLGGTFGIELGDPSQTFQANILELSNVVISASNQSVRVGVGSEIGTNPPVIYKLKVSNSAISAYRTAISLPAINMEVWGLNIDCVFGGLEQYSGDQSQDPEGLVLIDGLEIGGCIGTALATNLNENVSLNNIKIRDSDWGVYLGAGDSLMQNFSLQNVAYSLSHSQSDDQSLGTSTVLRNGVFEDSAYLAAIVDSGHVLIENVSFINNGHDWPDERRHRYSETWDDPRKYGGLIVRYNSPNTVDLEKLNWKVIDSIFEGNIPNGLLGNQIDARFNYWGSPSGPEIYFDANPTPPFPDPPPISGGGDGDRVNGQNLVYPYLFTRP